MPLPELTQKRIESSLNEFCEKRVPQHVRSKVFLSFEFRGNSVTLMENRVVWNDDSRWTKSPVAQFRLDTDSGKWTLYCCDRNSKWHLYDLTGPSVDFQKLVTEVDRDPTGIFWG